MIEIKKINKDKFKVIINWEFITNNLSFPEVDNNEIVVKETIEEFISKEKEITIWNIKKFFLSKFHDKVKALKETNKIFKNIIIKEKEIWVHKWSKILLLLNWVPWSWKSTWIRENNLEQYTVSLDIIRTLYYGNEYQLWIWEVLLDNNIGKTVKILLEIIEERMKQGIFTVCDWTNLKESDFEWFFRLASKYGYEINMKRMPTPSYEELVSRNKNRWYKNISEDILNIYLEREKSFKIPAWIKEINTIKDLNNYIWESRRITDGDVYYIGDIQGCSQELNTFLEKYYNKKDYFVFLWDLLDRWYDNLWVLEAIEKYDLTNNDKVYFIKGNHDEYLEKYFLENRFFQGSASFQETKEQIKDYSLEKIWNIVNKLVYATYFKIAWKEVFASHGWVDKIYNIINEKQLIKWIWSYEEHQICDEYFEKFSLNSSGQKYSVHWHRNTNEVSIKSTNRTFNLEWKVEFWWELRIVKFTQKGKTEVIDIPSINQEKYEFSLLNKFSKNRLIDIKNLWEWLYSVNFTRRAFNEKIWDSQTMKARWLFIWLNNEVYARSYNKFFNVWERTNTTKEFLLNNLSYPVSAYKKYNGFLGIVWVKDWNILYLSKSSNSSDFALLVKKHLEKIEDKLKDLLIKDFKWEYSLIFEICDDTDKHIVEEKERPILLDVVKNSIENFSKKSYWEVIEIWEILWVKVKELSFTLNNKEELIDFFNKASKVDFEWYILEDSNWFLTKTKSNKYLFWKEIRWDIRRLKWKNKNLLHAEVFDIFNKNNIPYNNLSIPELIKITENKWIKFSEIPKGIEKE